MRAVNLLPPERRKGGEGKKPKLTPIHAAGLAILIGAVGLGYWGNSIRGDVDAEKQKVADLEAQTASLQKEIADARAIAADSTYDVDRALVSGLASARVNWSSVMINLSRVAPSGVWLDSMSVTTPSGDAQAPSTDPTAKRPAAITLTAHSKTRTDAALFVSRLAGIPGFAEPRLAGGISPEDSDDGKSQSFSFNVEIPVDDGLFGPNRPPAQAPPTGAAAPATTTPQNP